jgi:hypothetical protein
MGETAAETMTEIDATRDRLDGELRQLEGRLPAVARAAKRTAAALPGVGLLGMAMRFALRRRGRKEATGAFVISRNDSPTWSTGWTTEEQ